MSCICFTIFGALAILNTVVIHSPYSIHWTVKCCPTFQLWVKVLKASKFHSCWWLNYWLCHAAEKDFHVPAVTRSKLLTSDHYTTVETVSNKDAVAIKQPHTVEYYIIIKCLKYFIKWKLKWTTAINIFKHSFFTLLLSNLCS